jgi:hypothetical protein
MYNAELLKANFASLVGFLQPNDVGYPAIPEALATSNSGRFVQMIHPLCTIENIMNAAPEFPTDAAFLAWLQKIYDSSVLELFTAFIRQRKLDNANRALLDSQILFDGIGSFVDRIIKKGRFVGFRINISAQQGLQVAIPAIGLQADAAQEITLYLYHSSQLEEVASYPITVERASNFNWTDIEGAILKFYDKNRNSEGVFYLGYYEDDLAGQAISRAYNWSTGPCGSCGQDWNVSAFNKWSKFVKIQAVSFPASAINIEKTIPDERKVEYDVQQNWGLNLSLSVACDMTDFFSLNKMIFADALAMQIAIRLLGVIAYTTRLTAIADQTKALAMADLDYSNKSSFAYGFNQELKALQIDFSGLSSQCMPVMKTAGIKFSAI